MNHLKSLLLSTALLSSMAFSADSIDVIKNTSEGKVNVDTVCPPDSFIKRNVVPDKFYRAEYDPEHYFWDAATEMFEYNGRNWRLHVFRYNFYGSKTIVNAMESAQTLTSNTIRMPRLESRPDLPTLYQCTYYQNPNDGLSIFTLQY